MTESTQCTISKYKPLERKSNTALICILVLLGVFELLLAYYLLSRDKVAPAPQKYACEVLSNGQVHSFNVDNKNVRLVKAD